jgi:capsular polysaccharide biosynthesis protein
MQEMKSPITLLAGVVLLLGGIALSFSGVLQWVRPAIFESETKIIVTRPGSTGGYDPLFVKTEAERIQSPAVLTNFIADLDLNDVWGKKYVNGQRLSDSQVEQLLKVVVQPVRNSDLIEIKVRSQDSIEAAALANGIVRSYRVRATQSKTASVSVVMSATAPTRAISPNRPTVIMIAASGIIMVIGGMFCLKEATSDSEA